MRIALGCRTELVRSGLAELLTEGTDGEVLSAATIDQLVDLVTARPVDTIVFELEDDPADQWRADAARLRIVARGATLLGLSRTRRVDSALRRHGCPELAGVVSLRAGLHELMRRLGLAVGAGDDGAAPAAHGGANYLSLTGRQVLTPREVEVLKLLGGGHSTNEIAEVLGISAKTIENHKQHIYAKLGVQNQSHAVALGVRRGMITPTLKSIPVPTSAVG
ncbi:MAG TPA: response regulator transcription factor [Acidimicrobiales bacterium]|nr:response regulator transcription factor [Acidimicrobiales bacterium]